MGKIALAIFASAVVAAAAYVYPRYMAIVVNQGQLRKLEQVMQAPKPAETMNASTAMFGQYV